MEPSNLMISPAAAHITALDSMNDVRNLLHTCASITDVTKASINLTRFMLTKVPEIENCFLLRTNKI